MSTPKVSVLLATYNRAHLIGRAIESVMNQSFRGWELVVADDGSTDDTRRAVEAFVKKDDRIRYLRCEHAGRIAVISNYGLKQARGEHVAIIDDDDAWIDSRKLEKQVKYLDAHPECVGCGGGFIVVDDKGAEKLRVLKPERDEDIRRNALLANPMANSTTLFRRSVARAVGDYDETMREFADWDFWLKMGLKGALYNFPEYFANYTMWSEGASFARHRGTSASSLCIVLRYRGKYPRFLPALGASITYYLYAHLPEAVKRILNPVLSRTKKTIFSR